MYTIKTNNTLPNDDLLAKIINKTLESYLYCTFRYDNNIWNVNINNMCFTSVFNIIVINQNIELYFIDGNEIILYQLYLWITCSIENHDKDDKQIVNEYFNYNIIQSNTHILFEIACLTINPMLHPKIIELDYLYFYYVLMISQNYLNNDFKTYPAITVYNLSTNYDINTYFNSTDKKNLVNYITNIKTDNNNWKYVCYNLLEKIE